MKLPTLSLKFKLLKSIHSVLEWIQNKSFTFKNKVIHQAYPQKLNLDIEYDEPKEKFEHVIKLGASDQIEALATKRPDGSFENEPINNEIKKYEGKVKARAQLVTELRQAFEDADRASADVASKKIAIAAERKAKNDHLGIPNN